LKNKPFEKWTKDEMEFVAKYLPKTNWVKELDLDRIEKDRDASLQLDLQTEENQALLAVTLPEDYRALLTSKDVQNWTLEQMEGLAHIVDELRVLGREELRIKNEARLEEAEKKRTMIEREIRSSGVEIHTEDPDWLKEKKMKDIENFNKNRLPDILGLNSAAKGTLENTNDKQRGIFKRIINGYGDANIRRVSRILDNDKEGINTTLLFYREDECFNAEQKAITSRTKKITDAMNNLGITIEELYSPVEIEFYGGRKEYITYTDTNNNQHKLTMDEVLYIIAAADDERSRLAVACGNLVTAEEKDSYKQQGEKGEETCFAVGTARMDDIIKQAATINPKWIKFLATIQEDYAQQYERMNKVSIEEFNQPVARVKNYVPLNRLESNGDTNVNRVKEDLLGSSAVGGANWVDKGMTKSRVDISPTNQKPVVMGLYSTWADSLNRTEHFLNYASYVRELNRVYKSRDSQLLRNHIENRYSKDMLTYIDEYIQELANPDVSSAQNQLDRIARALRGKTASAYLAWKTSSVIKQFCTSPWPYMRFTSPVKYLASMFDFIRHPGQMSDLIKSKSAYMNSRRFDPIADLIDEQQKKATNKVSSALAGFENMGMQGLEMVDWVCVAPGWLAVYKDEFARLSSDKEQKKLIEQKKKELEKYADVEGWDWIDAEAQKAALTEGEIERLAVRKADDITRQCQPSNRLTDLSPIFKQRGPGSEIGRIFLQFTTSLNVIWQNIRYDIPSDIRHGEYKRALMTIAGYALAGITMGLVTEGLTDDDDDENADAKQIAYYGSTQFTDSIPVIGSVVTAAVKQLITGKKNYSQGVSDIFPQLTKISKGLASASEGKWTNACSNFAYALALSLGLPVSGAKELGEAAGLTDDEEGLDFKPEAFIGRR
ncbi:MAG: hypothetical protein MJ052_05645, partial [Sphaerochaetaceae bacterium]|nr:hypothetical protein [Sphaerochaetaceae bacterium]